MRKDVFVTVAQRMSSFSKGQKRIAAFVLENRETAAFMTANALAKAAGVSEATVVRFGGELGYGGYPGLQKAMQEAVMHRLASRTPDTVEQADLLTSVLRDDGDRLCCAAGELDHQAFAAGVEILSRAKRVYVIGSRWEAPVVLLAGYRLEYLVDGVRTVIASGEADALEAVMGVKPEDAVLVLDTGERLSAGESAIRFCRDIGAAVVAVTADGYSAVAGLSNAALIVKVDRSDFMAPPVVQMSLIGALTAAIAEKKEAALRQKLTALEQIRKDYLVGEKKGDSR